MGTGAPRDVVALRDVIAREPLAPKKWPQVVDQLVNDQGDVHQIKQMLKEGHFKEAVLQSLHEFFSGGGTTAELAAMLAGVGLKVLAEQILEPEAGRARAQEAGADRTGWMWCEVGQLIQNFSGRQSVIETLHKRLGDPENRAAGTASVVTISGLGGIGKSTLARKYAYTHQRFYGGNVLWINAETVDSMRASFIRLAKALGLQLGDQPPNALLMEKVFAHFQNKKCLLIFDNVENLTEFKQFLPKILNPSNEVPYMLVTSRRTDLNALPANEIHLDVLTPEEAVELIHTQLPKATIANAVKLAEKLHGLPLALQQAVAYIRHTYLEDDDEAILEYLKEFERSEAELLNDERFRKHNDYSSTTFTTWQITLTRIREMADGELAIRVITALAYLNPDLISLQFLKGIFEEAETRRGLKLLERFSMISVSDGKVSIHRLVQHVVRLSFGERAEDEIQTLVTAIRRQFAKGGFRLNDINRECSSHGLHLFPFQMTHRDSAPSIFDYFVTLCNYLLEYGNYAAALSISQQMASLYESVFGERHVTTITMKIQMSHAYSLLESLSDSVPLLNSILPVAKSALGIEHRLTVGIQARLATDLGETGDNEEAVRIYDEILLVAERLYGKNDNDVLLYKVNKATALRRLGKLDEALQLLQHVHENEVWRLGENHVRTLEVINQIAAVHYEKKEFSRALEMWEEVEAGWSSTLGDTHPDTVKVQNNIAACKAELAKRERQNCQML